VREVGSEKETAMEQIQNFNWAQGKINEILISDSQERRYAVVNHFPGENREQRRKRQKQERRAAKKKVAVRA
jgi:hypothetical protein